MANLAISTGGLLFENNNDLTLGFERLGLAPSVSYELGFSPAHLMHDGKLHKLKVELDPPIKGASIEARRGYFAPPPGPTAGELAYALDAAMRANSQPRAVPAALSLAAKPGGLAVTVNVEVKRRSEHYQMLAGLYDSLGRFVTERGELDLALSRATYKRDRNRRLSPIFTLLAPSGAYRLRVVVEEASDGAISTFSQPVRIH